MKYRQYDIAGIRVRLTAPQFDFRGLAPFAAPEQEAPDTDTPPAPTGFEIRQGEIAVETADDRVIDTFDFPDADARCRLIRQTAGYLLSMEPRGTRCVRFRIPDAPASDKSATALQPVTTDFMPEDKPALFRFGMWMVYNIHAAQRGIAAIHASVLVHGGGAVLCLGESGTGKSTHTRLWQEHIPDTRLLNDDSPLALIHDGQALVHGSPWSGKTPCYRNERYPIRAFVRLSQAPENRIERLAVLHAYAALQPSFPPSFAHDERLAECIDALLSELLRRVPVYRLACRPDADAAKLACETIYGQNF